MAMDCTLPNERAVRCVFLQSGCDLRQPEAIMPCSSEGWSHVHDMLQLIVATESVLPVHSMVASYCCSLATYELHVATYQQGLGCACRACMAPFIANNTAGIESYKWMLFGDDDTVFYVDNILRMLETLDHTMPYILSDHIWFPTDLESKLHPCSLSRNCELLACSPLCCLFCYSFVSCLQACHTDK